MLWFSTIRTNVCFVCRHWVIFLYCSKMKKVSINMLQEVGLTVSFQWQREWFLGTVRMIFHLNITRCCNSSNNNSSSSSSRGNMWPMYVLSCFSANSFSFCFRLAYGTNKMKLHFQFIDSEIQESGVRLAQIFFI